MSSINWVGFFIDVKYLKRSGFSKVESELKFVFKKDLIDIFFMDMSNSGQVDDQIDSYVFVKCNDYFKYVPKLMSCRYITCAIESFENPYFIDEKEIIQFRKNIILKNEERLKKNANVSYGDIVQIKDGMYRNLYGVIVGVIKENVDVFFKFNSFSFKKRINLRDVEVVGNFFDKIFGGDDTDTDRRYPVILRKEK